MTFVLNNVIPNFEGYQRLITLYNEYKNVSFENLNIEIKNWFSANLCSPLGAILDILEENILFVNFKEISENIKIILKKNEFLTYYFYDKKEDDFGTTIKYQKLKPTDGRYFFQYVENELISHPELPIGSNEVKDKILESIYEIFTNSKLHSETKNIYSCGQFFPKKHIIEFTITDIGIGIRERINRTFGKKLTSIQAIKWALLERSSTKLNIPGGLGLTLIKEFILQNKGKFQIVSNDGFYEFANQKETFKLFKNGFPGTIVNVQFKTI